MTREEFVFTVRSFLNTPFRHQGRLPGHALDCAGLVVCAAQACGHAMRDQTGYSAVPHADLFTAAVAEHCDRIESVDILPGDLMTFAFTREPQHVAVVTQFDPVRIAHAWQDVGKVVETDLDDYWARRLRGCWRLRGLA